MSRTATFERTTREIRVALTLNLDDSKKVEVEGGIGFFDHLLTTLARDARFDLSLCCEGGRPTLCICVGLQLLFEKSEGSPGVRALGIVPRRIERFPESVRVPQLGENRIEADACCRVLAVRERLDIPLIVGGSVRSVFDAEALLSAGADKMAVNTAAVRSPELLSALAERFGRQCVVLDARAARTEGGSYEVVVESETTRTGIDAVAWAKEATRLGAKEVLLTSFDSSPPSTSKGVPPSSSWAAASATPGRPSTGSSRAPRRWCSARRPAQR